MDDVLAGILANVIFTNHLRQDHLVGIAACDFLTVGLCLRICACGLGVHTHFRCGSEYALPCFVILFSTYFLQFCAQLALSSLIKISFKKLLIILFLLTGFLLPNFVTNPSSKRFLIF